MVEAESCEVAVAVSLGENGWLQLTAPPGAVLQSGMPPVVLMVAPEQKMSDSGIVPVKVIWEEFDSYITSDVAKDRVSHFRHGSLHLLPAGHWVQSEVPEQVARLMLGEA